MAATAIASFVGIPGVPCHRAARRFTPPRIRSAAASSPRHSWHDVVVVGGGIIGLTVARRLLMDSDLSVAVVDAHVPCFGATGAGQGYLWMVHRTPGSPKWDLAVRSRKLWEDLVGGIVSDGGDPLNLLGWKTTGSLLVGTTSEQSAMLEGRVKLLTQAGLRAEFLPYSSLLAEEPALEVGKGGSAAFLPDDFQIDAQRTVEFIEQGNRRFTSQGRYTEYFNDKVISLLRSGSSGVVEAVQTSKNVLNVAKAVVIAAGSWSGFLMRDIFKGQNVVPYVPVKPRKGHLIVLEGFNQLQLNHGLMEAGYIDHQSAQVPGSPFSSEVAGDEQNFSSVSMTATIDAIGSLVLGSSREFSGFNTEVDECVISTIWNRAGEFFPTLRGIPINVAENRKIRVGLRPYVPDGRPIIGPAQGFSNVFLATGHEGEGLSLALGTAEMVSDMILGNIGRVDCTPFIYPR